MSTLTFNDIQYNLAKGTLSFSQSDVEWRALANAGNEKIPANKLTYFEWLFAAPRGFSLRCYKGQQIYHFTGFKKQDQEKIASFISANYQQQLENIDVSSRGVNWGDLQISSQGTHVTLKVDNKQIFDVPVALVKNCRKAPKSKELVLEMNQDEELVGAKDDFLAEVRFFFPKEVAQGEEEPLEKIFSAITKKSENLTEATGEAIASFQQLNIVTPRGKYTVDLFKKFMRLHGKTYDFKIPYKSINTMFLLAKPDNAHMYFVISLDAPIRTGNTPHSHLVFEFDKNASFSKDAPLKLNMAQDELQQYAQKQITEQMTGKIYEVVAKVFRALTDKKLIGTGTFTSLEGHKGIKCSVKANEGYLFFLEKSVLFLHKPPLYIRHEEIKSVNMKRAEKGAGATKYFEINIKLKNNKVHTFSNIMKNESDGLIAFLTKKSITVENVGQTVESNQAAAMDADDDEEEDEDFNPDADDEDEDDKEFDAHVENKEVEADEADDKAIVSSKRKRSQMSADDSKQQKQKQKKK